MNREEARKRKEKFDGARKFCPATVHRVMLQSIEGVVVIHDRQCQGEV